MMVLKNITLLTLLLFIFYEIKAQNIVPNPKFDSLIKCPSAFGEISATSNWQSLPNHTGSPDYFNSCYLNHQGYISTPGNFMGTEKGNAYVGLSLYHSVKNFREYLQVELTEPMVASKIYQVRFKYSLADKSIYSSDGCAIHFSPSPLSGANNSAPLNMTPSLRGPSISMNKKDGWVTVIQFYRATGGEKYMVVGNFLDDNNTTVSTISNGEKYTSYIYLDDFWVAEEFCDVLVDLGRDRTICDGDTALLDATDPFAQTYLWNNGSTNSTLSATQPGKYWVTISGTNCFASDTINVISKPCNCKSFVPNAFSPNNDGRNDFFGLHYICAIDNYYLSIYNRWGQKIFQSNSIDYKWDGTISGTPADIGGYFYLIRYDSEESQGNIKSGHLTLIR